MARVYYVLAKNLATGKTIILKSDCFYELEANRKCSKFQPKSINDFKKVEEYGFVEGEWMIRAFILAMAESEAEINEKQKVQRENPKRLNHGPPKDLRSLWKVSSDKKEAKRKNDVEAPQKEMQGSVLRAFNKKSNDSTAQKEQREKEQAKSPNDFAQHPVEVNSEPMTQNYAEEVMSLLTKIASDQKGMKEEMVKMRRDVNCSLKSTEEDLKELRASVAELSEKMSNLLASSPKMELTHVLRQTFSVIQDSPDPDYVQDEWERRDDEIYCGNGVYIEKKKLLEIDPRDSLQKQVTAVANLIYPGSLHTYAFHPKPGQEYITDGVVHAIRALVNLINKSPSSTHAECSNRVIREKLKHSTHSARQQMNTGTAGEKSSYTKTKRQPKGKADSGLAATVAALEAAIDEEEARKNKKNRTEPNEKEEEQVPPESEGEDAQPVPGDDTKKGKYESDESDIEEYEAMADERKRKNSRLLSSFLKTFKKGEQEIVGETDDETQFYGETEQ